MRGVGPEIPGQRLAGLAHEVFLKLLKAKREVPTAAQRQEVLAVQQGLRALCGCTVTQSACELDHVAPVRQLFADSAHRLQALCVDCHSEKTLRESAQPTSLESRVCPGVMEANVRSPTRLAKRTLARRALLGRPRLRLVTSWRRRRHLGRPAQVM